MVASPLRSCGRIVPPTPRGSLRSVAAAPRRSSTGSCGLEDKEKLEYEIKELIISALALEDIGPSDIESEAVLFVEGLGLDSIDALEPAMALEERYGVKIGEDPELNQEIFASVRNLAGFVSENRTQ